MPNIFTRSALNRIMEDETLTPEQRTEQVFSLYGRALEDGYVGRAAARQAREAAVEEARAQWTREHPAADVRQSDEYRALRGEFDAYRAMQQTRTSGEFSGVKPKFFETVYGMVDRGEGAPPVGEQLAGIRREFEEFFQAATDPSASRPAPAVVLPAAPAKPAGRMTLGEAMRRANAGENVDVALIGR